MENIVAILGVLLFWATLFWLPLNLYRVFHTEGRQRIWLISALFASIFVFMGYTRAIAGGTVMEAFAWSVSWLMPVGLTWFARGPADTPYRGADKWIAGAVLLSFPLAMGVLPRLLRSAADTLW